MKNTKIELFKLLSEDLMKNVNTSVESECGGLSTYGYDNDRNTCKTSLKAQIRQLRKVLLDIGEEIK